jgi:hypothetical protein
MPRRQTQDEALPDCLGQFVGRTARLQALECAATQQRLRRQIAAAVAELLLVGSVGKRQPEVESIAIG